MFTGDRVKLTGTVRWLRQGVIATVKWDDGLETDVWVADLKPEGEPDALPEPKLSLLSRALRWRHPARRRR